MTAPKPLDLESWCQERAETFRQYEQIEMAMFPSAGYREIALVEWTVRTLGNPEVAESREVLGILAERHGVALEKYGNELRDRRTEDLAVRGVLSPNGSPRVVPMELGASLVPAVQWLIADRDALRAANEKLLDHLSALRAEVERLTNQLGEATVKAVVTGGPVVQVDDGCPNCPPGHDCERGNYATTRDSTVAEFRAGMAAQVRRDLAAEFGVALPDTTTEGAR